MLIQIRNHYDELVPAGEHVLSAVTAADYVVTVSANNGGATSFETEDGVQLSQFTSGSAYAGVVTVPTQPLLITLAGEERIQFIIRRRPQS